MEFISILLVSFCFMRRIRRDGKILYGIIYYLMNVLLKCFEKVVVREKVIIGF